MIFSRDKKAIEALSHRVQRLEQALECSKGRHEWKVLNYGKNPEVVCEHCYASPKKQEQQP